MSTAIVLPPVMVNVKVQNLSALMYRLEIKAETIQLFFPVQWDAEGGLPVLERPDNLMRK